MFIDLIISEDTMSFISGKVCSHVLEDLHNQQIIEEIPMFISTDLRQNVKGNVPMYITDEMRWSIKEKFGKIVRNVYSKPLDNASFENIMRICEI